MPHEAKQVEEDVNEVSLETVKQWFSSNEDLSTTERAISEKSRDYYDNDQYTEDELATYRKRKQPPITKNRIKPNVDFLLGMERQTRTDPQAAPRNPEDIEGAQAATDSIRYVADNQNFDQLRSWVFESMLIEGTGGIECTVEQKIFQIPEKEPEIEIIYTFVPWDRWWWDRHSRRPDYEDAKYLGTVLWMDLDDAKSEFPGADSILEDTLSSDGTGFEETYDDVPRDRWADEKRKRVKIATVWYHSGDDWYFGTFSGGGWLVEPQKSPFMDEDGNTEHGAMLQSAFVTREAERYGFVYPLLSIQDAINHLESKAIHLTNVERTVGSEDAGVNIADMKKELAKADGHVTLPPGKKFGEDFSIIPNNEAVLQNMGLLQESKEDIDRMGIGQSLTGEASATSGRDRIAQQQASKMQLGPIFDNLRMWQLRVYRFTWNRVKQYWTKPKMIRITDDPKNAKFVGLNQPFTVRDQITEQIEAGGENAEKFQQGLQLLEERQDPRLDEVLSIKNNTAELNVDIIMTEAPDTTTLVGEQFESIVGLAQSGVMQIPPKLILEMSDLPDKDRLIEILEENEKAQAQGNQQQQQIAMEQMKLAFKEAIADIANTDADTQLKVANAEKAQADAAESATQARENVAEGVTKELIAGLGILPGNMTYTL